MPRNGSNIYFIPPGTEGFPDTTIESEKYNNYIHDVEDDLNKPRPVVAGGTGSASADGALVNLSAEKASQNVTNYDTHLWMPGSFYSDSNATGAPINMHSFSGWATCIDSPQLPPLNNNVVVYAYDISDDTVPGRLYTREKKSGVWGTWHLAGAGISGSAPPPNPSENMLWWDTETGTLYIYYRDVDSAQWVIASPQPDPAQFIMKAGDTMTGPLTLAANPTEAMHAATRNYVDIMGSNVSTALAGKVSDTGDTMSGNLIISPSNLTSALILNKETSGDQSLVMGTNHGTLRWVLGLGSTAPETGSAFGSDFFLNSYDDGGNYVATPMFIKRNTGEVTFKAIKAQELSTTAGVTVAGNISSSGTISTTGTISTNALTANSANVVNVCNAGSFHVSTGYMSLVANTTQSVLYFNQPSNSFLNYNGPTGELTWYVNNVAQLWLTYLGGGSNTSNLTISGKGYQPGGGSWLDASDMRIKNVLGEYDKGLDDVVKLRPVRYTYKGNDTADLSANSPHKSAAEAKTQFAGLVAQEVEGAFPEMVSKRTGYIDGKEVTDLRDLDPTALIYALVNSVKELKAEIEALKAGK